MNINFSFLDELANKLSAVVPQDVKTIKQDMEKNFKAVLQANLAKLDVVTREEFDTQAALLAKAQQQLKIMEQRLAELEAQNKIR